MHLGITLVAAAIWAVPALGAESTSAFDPKGYIQELPVDADEDEEAEEAPSPGKPETSTPGVVKAEVTVQGQSYTAYRSSFGTIYLARDQALIEATLARAACANTKPAPSSVGPDQPLSQVEMTRTADIVKAIERNCKAATPGKGA